MWYPEPESHARQSRETRLWPEEALWGSEGPVAAASGRMSSWSIPPGPVSISWLTSWPGTGWVCTRSRRTCAGRVTCAVAYPYRSYVEQPLVKESSDAFQAMVDRVDPACIIPCTEEALYWLWDQPGHIQRLCLPDVAPAVRPLLLDRALLLEEAAACGVPVPTAMPLGSRADCDTAIAGGLPLMVKSGRSVGSKGIALCRTPEEVIGAFERFAPLGTSVTAQRFYTGPTYMAGALFVHGEAVHLYSGEKTVMLAGADRLCL